MLVQGASETRAKTHVRDVIGRPSQHEMSYSNSTGENDKHGAPEIGARLEILPPVIKDRDEMGEQICLEWITC